MDRADAALEAHLDSLQEFDCWQDDHMKEVAGDLSTQVQLLLMTLSEINMHKGPLTWPEMANFYEALVSDAKSIERRCKELYRESL